MQSSGNRKFQRPKSGLHRALERVRGVKLTMQTRIQQGAIGIRVLGNSPSSSGPACAHVNACIMADHDTAGGEHEAQGDWKRAVRTV